MACKSVSQKTGWNRFTGKEIARNCLHCGTFFTPATNRIEICSDACRSEREAYQIKQWHKNTYVPKARPKKTCPECGKQFEVKGSNHKYCSDPCYKLNRKGWTPVPLIKRVVECGFCGVNFSPIRNQPVKYCSKKCCDLAKYHNDKPRAKSYMLEKLYGIDLAEYERLLELQKGQCAICDSNDPGGKGSFHVDHCHESGKVRGLLCHHCNTAIGSLRDDKSILVKAMQYLS